MLQVRNYFKLGIALTTVIFLFVLGIEVTQAAKAPPAPLTIKSAVYNKKAAKLTVKTVVKNTSGLLTLLHNKGGVLGQTRDNKHTFSIPLAQLGDIPCQVEVRLGDLKVNRAVKGAAADCKKVPICTVLSPVENASAAYNQNTPFEAQVILKDKKAGPIHYEWDFAGGVMGHPSGQLPGTGNVKADATFVRNNSRYRVRFTATDALGRRCESSVNVVVGTLPAGLPNIAPLAEAAQQSAPSKANALQKAAGERVVLPYQDWTMQTATDARTVPNVYVTYGPQVNNILATVYEKARKPPVIGSDRLELRYSAASNPADPVGPNSINSTSQNWPLNASLQQADLQKSDYFESYVRPANAILADGYYSYSFAGFLTPELASAGDEGYHDNSSTSPLNPDHGRYMPGIAAPYAANDPQPFSKYNDNDSAFLAQMLPLTDIDDSGRVNPTPLYRIEARNPGTATPVTMTDLAVTASRDFHCRECHAKGQIGAKQNYSISPYMPFSYVDSNSDSLFDQEYAAVWNTANRHTFRERDTSRMDNGGSSKDADGNITFNNDGPAGCADAGTCHTTVMSSTVFGKLLGDRSPGGKLSLAMHRFHGLMQYNAGKDDVVRSSYFSVSIPAFIDPENNWDPKTGSIPNSLFPVKDANGNMLPMEQNCLKCHGGQREQSYRDRMFTAGVTCYQCHGDMMAVGGFMKSTPGADGSIYRQPWIDEPDCGSCHTGNANQGKSGNEDFFSGGVKRLAFDKNDRTATPRQPDRLSPDEIRFAVPITTMALGNSDTSSTPDSEGNYKPFTTKAPLYRAGKDNHGQVPCGACHGAAHAIWPNRDPNANDNVTAMQLQGHNGSIAECSVCHTADSFAKFEDLDEGVRAADAKTGILGGPHNLHPINDPNWWKQAGGDTVDSTPNKPKRKGGAIKGGWHNDYAKLPGRQGEDQCAACHGNDHLGTRLSKTPVDREFVNEKGKKVKVKAGTPIGCNLCHTVEKSCTASPSGTNCGKPSEQVTKSGNQAPVITSSADTQVIIGEDYHHDVEATDLEGTQLNYQFLAQPVDGASIDPSTGVVTIPAEMVAAQATAGHGNNVSLDTHHTVLFLLQYRIVVRDSQGAQTVQLVRINFDCPTGLTWDQATHSCAKIALTSLSPIEGLNGGETYNYPVIAWQRNGETLSYSLTGQPQGMSIDSKTGMINWVTPSNLTDLLQFTITVSTNNGDSVQQKVSLAVCSAPQQWDILNRSCLGPITFTSDPTVYGMTAGTAYTDTVIATHANNLPITYSLTNAPTGMTIDTNSGQVNWQAQASVSGSVTFTVKALDGQGGVTQKTWPLLVCAAPEIWDGSVCKGPIEFTSTPFPGGLDVGQTYQYQVSTTHANGLSVTYSLGGGTNNPTDTNPIPIPKPAGMSINPQTGLISWVSEPQPAETSGTAYFSVIATDSQGYVSNPKQFGQVQVCVPPFNWDDTMGYCRGPLRITSTQPVLGLDVGQTFSYQVTTTEANPAGLPITYKLDYLQPEGTNMSIDANTGLITWVAAEDPNNIGAQIQYQVNVSDSLGQTESQSGYLTVCVPPQHWNAENQGCL